MGENANQCQEIVLETMAQAFCRPPVNIVTSIPNRYKLDESSRRDLHIYSHGNLGLDLCHCYFDLGLQRICLELFQSKRGNRDHGVLGRVVSLRIDHEDTFISSGIDFLSGDLCVRRLWLSDDHEACVFRG